MLKTNRSVILTTVLILTSVIGLAMAEGANFSGNWQGTWNSTYGRSGGLTASVTQAGSVLSGKVDVKNTECGDFLGLNLTGTVSGSTASFQASAVCPADGSVNKLRFTSGVLSGNSMNGSYQTYSDGDPYDSGYFTLSRPAGQLESRYRLYNPNNYHHHYTTDQNEYNHLGTIGWIQEGTSCKLYDGFHSIGAVETVPYYRLYNPNSFEHHWTTDANEYNVLGARGWSQEGVDGYVFGSPVSDSAPLYRLYNPNDGLHHWTMDTNERSVLIGRGFVDEGIACYVFSTGEPPTPDDPGPSPADKLAYAEAMVVGAWSYYGYTGCSTPEAYILASYFLCPGGGLKGVERTKVPGISERDYLATGSYEVKATPSPNDDLGSLVLDYTTKINVGGVYDEGPGFLGQSPGYMMYLPDRDNIVYWFNSCWFFMKRLDDGRPTDVVESDCGTSGGGSGEECGTDADCGRCWYCDKSGSTNTCRYGGDRYDPSTGDWLGCYRGWEPPE